MASRLADLRSSTSLRLGLAVALLALGLGALLGFGGVIITVAVLATLGLAAVALSRLDLALWGIVAVITLLPFGALPFKVVFTPTFLDVALLGALAVYALQWMNGQRRRLALTPAHAPIAAFMLFAVFSFVAGLPNGPLTANLIRQFAELLLSVGFSFVIVDSLQSRAALARLARAIMIGGTLSAAAGILLYLLPEALAEGALSTLRVFNYPSGEVLRYIEGNPDNPQRAISTSIDPNALGGMLAMVGGLLAPQLLTRRTVLGARPVALAMFAVVTACLVLTFSRGAMAALAAALGLIALARYRRMIWIAVLAALLILLLPATQEYVTHFVRGLQGQDLATQMRFGEYKDAFILIGRYPALGVGFSGAPEIDTYLGVSNAYLLMTSEMGLVGLALFLSAIAAVFGWALTRRREVYADEQLTGLWLGALSGLAAALVVGLVDHYFFNLEFHAAGTLFWIFVGLSLAATRLAEAGGRGSRPV